jgi:hypothetical protein
MRAALGALALLHVFFWVGPVRRHGSAGDEARVDGVAASCSRAPPRGLWAAALAVGDDVTTANERGSRASRTMPEAWAAGLWPVATYWDFGKQPDDQLAGLQATWGHILRVFRDEGVMPMRNSVGSASPQSQPGVDDEMTKWLAVGADLCHIAAVVAARTHGDDPTSPAPPRQTLIHGDPKAANFFFREGATTPAVGLIDFQWTGHGLCATDVAYCVLASTSIEAVVVDAEYAAGLRANVSGRGGLCVDSDAADSEEFLIRRYHAELVSAAAGVGETAATPDIPSWETFWGQYRVAFIDVCRAMIGSWWDVPGNRDASKGPNIVQLLKHRGLLKRRQGLVFNACNKDLALACWSLRRLRVYTCQHRLDHPEDVLPA